MSNTNDTTTITNNSTTEYEAFLKQAAAERTELGRQRFKEVMVSEAPPRITPYMGNGVVDSVFAELWNRPGLSRRDRRWITLACVGAAAVHEPIRSHIYAALASGDITREEYHEFELHFAYYHGWPRTSLLTKVFFEVVADLEKNPPKFPYVEDDRLHPDRNKK